MDAGQLWQVALAGVRARVSPGAYAAWFGGSAGLELAGGVLTVGVPSTFASEHLRARFADLARQVVSEAAGKRTDVVFVVRPGLRGRQSRARASGGTGQAAPVSVRGAAAVARPARTLPRGTRRPLAAQPALALEVAEPSPVSEPGASAVGAIVDEGVAVGVEQREAEGVLQPRYTFETFVVATANRLAYAAAQEVAARPGESYNPLLIYGGVGLGKTHLLHAIGHAVRAAGRSVLYVTAERFTNEIVEAIRRRTTEEFRARFRRVDVLLVDDVQFIAGKEATEEEFFHTFNALHEANRQIVLTSDRVPQAMRDLHLRLRSRFEWGLIADIQPPDYAHRLAILEAKAAGMGMAAPAEVLERLARPPCDNVRALEGALTRVAAAARLLVLPLDVALVEHVLGSAGGLDAGGGPVRAPDPEGVLAAVARHYAVTAEELRGTGRARAVALARQVAMYLLREETTASLGQIGRLLGGRDHTTVMHGCARVGEVLASDTRLRDDVAAIRTALLG